MSLAALDPSNPIFKVTPALSIPNYVPNFDDPKNIALLIKFTVGICFAASTVMILLRIWVRFFIMKAHGWDDYTMILAWLCFIPYVVLGLIALEYGSGVHQYDVRLSDFFVFLKYANVLEVLYNPLIFITKLSILLQYLRIFCPNGATNGWTRKIIWGLVLFNLLFYIAVMIPQIMACNPREKIWHPLIDGKCLDLSLILIAGAIVNIFSDLSILILPMVKVWQLQLTRSKKLGLVAVFATGIFACLSSILRLENNVHFRYTKDVTWDLTPVALWTMAEISSGIICGCLPAVPLFFRHFVPRLRSTMGSLTGRKKTSASTKGTSQESSGHGVIKKSVYIELSGRAASVTESQERIHQKM